MKDLSIGIIEWTVRDELAKDFSGTYKKIAEIGYSYVEQGGFGPYSIKEWNELLEKCNLKVVCNHFGVEMLEQNLSHLAEYGKALGYNYMGYPCLRNSSMGSEEGYKNEAAAMNLLGRRCKEKGFTLIYHNHDFEFAKYNGKCGMDILFENTDPDLVKFEIDVYWVTFAGEDPVKHIKKFKNRCDIIHLKDMANDNKRSFTEVGEGIIDFKAILNTALETGVRYFIVEQDICTRPCLESVKISYDNIKKIIQNI